MRAILPLKYQSLIQDLKEKIRRARFRAISAANKEMLLIYWEIGKTIHELVQSEGWGSGIVDKIAQDLKIEFPDLKGMSSRSLRYMREFYRAYPQLQSTLSRGKKKKNTPILQRVAAKLAVQNDNNQTIIQTPWTYHQILLDKNLTFDQRIFYMQKTVENHWSRNILLIQIEQNLFERSGKSINNFEERLPALQSDLAKATFKNPYIFEFLNLGEEILERDLEKALLNHLEKFLLELGRGFAFMGSQYRIDIDGKEYFPDLVFYNIQLEAYVIFELKISEFAPEFAGKLNFYVTAFDNQVKSERQNPTIGVLLCKTPNETVIRFSLEKIDSPIGVSDYKLARAIPKKIKGSMPTIKELTQEVTQEIERLKGPDDKRWENLKKKLAHLNKGEIRKTATQDILDTIFNNSMQPLYTELIEKMREFNPEFILYSYSWSGAGEYFSSFRELEENWKIKNLLNNNREIHFWYRLSGL